MGQGLGPGVRRLMIAIAATSVGALILRSSAPGVWPTIERHLLLTPEQVLPGLELWQPFTYLFFHHRDPFDLLIALLLLWMFGTTFEARWGTRAFVRFFFMAGAGAGFAAAIVGLLAPGSVGPHTYAGSWPVQEALIGAFAVTFPDSPIYLFFVLPIRGRHLLIGTLAITILYALFSGTLVPFIPPLAGLGLGVLLAGGRFTPRRSFLSVKARWLEWRYRRARRHLRPVEGERARWVH